MRSVVQPGGVWMLSIRTAETSEQMNQIDWLILVGLHRNSGQRCARRVQSGLPALTVSGQDGLTTHPASPSGRNLDRGRVRLLTQFPLEVGSFNVSIGLSGGQSSHQTSDPLKQPIQEAHTSSPETVYPHRARRSGKSGENNDLSAS